MPIRISASIDGFRRAGMAHTAEPKTYPDGFFTEDQLKQLMAEPRLAVSSVGELPNTEADPSADQAGAVEPFSVPGDLSDAVFHGVTDADGNIRALDELTAAELRDIAKDMEISGYSSMNKADLVAAIMAVPVQVEAEGEA